MDRLPNFERAIIPPAKLRYCLDSTHPVGRHKARVFKSALGLGEEDTARLERILREGIARHEPASRSVLPDGTERWVVEWVARGRLGPLRFISAWDRNRPGGIPRLVSCYVKRVRS